MSKRFLGISIIFTFSLSSFVMEILTDEYNDDQFMNCVSIGKSGWPQPDDSLLQFPTEMDKWQQQDVELDSPFKKRKLESTSETNVVNENKPSGDPVHVNIYIVANDIQNYPYNTDYLANYNYLYNYYSRNNNFPHISPYFNNSLTPILYGAPCNLAQVPHAASVPYQQFGTTNIVSTVEPPIKVESPTQKNPICENLQQYSYLPPIKKDPERSKAPVLRAAIYCMQVKRGASFDEFSHVIHVSNFREFLNCIDLRCSKPRQTVEKNRKKALRVHFAGMPKKPMTVEFDLYPKNRTKFENYWTGSSEY